MSLFKNMEKDEMKEISGFKYLCDAKTLFDFMNNEIMTAIENNFSYVTNFYVVYKNKNYHINIENKNQDGKVISYIYLNNDEYNSLNDFINNAKIANILIKDIKDDLTIILTDSDSVYLESHEKMSKKINKKTFKYTESIYNTFLFGSIFFLCFALLSPVLFNHQGKTSVIISLVIFSTISILFFITYLHYKNKIFTFDRDKFILNYLIGKKEVDISNIVSVKEMPLKGLIIT